MSLDTMTDDRILDLVNVPKRVTNPQARRRIENGYARQNFTVQSEDGTLSTFEIYLRQNQRPEMQDNFSCGLRWIAPNGESLTLRRYNGPSHRHGNRLENATLDFKCHIHFASEKYIQSGLKAEGFAEETNRYRTLEGALHCLVTDCKITGIQTRPDALEQEDLFT